jgi:hypothetical protein
MTAFRPALVAIGAAYLVACAQQPPEKQPPVVSVPVPLIRDVCERAHLEVGSGHFDGRANLVWSNGCSRVLALDCSFTVFLDGLTTTTVRVYLSDPRAQGLRDFLGTRGAH